MSVTELGPREAQQLLTADPNAVLLDVRSKMEFEYIGHPLGALHVALMEPPTWQTDPEFIAKVRRQLQTRSETPEESLTVLTLCRSGKRSLSAANFLVQAGFKKVYNIREGFEGDLDAQKHRNTLTGWRACGLPWEQS